MNEFHTDQGLELAAVRSQLNELRFEHGVRRLRIGLVSELFPDQSPAAIAGEIQRISEQLSAHDLRLEQPPDNPDQLWVVQSLTHRPTDVNAMARAMQWVARITTVALEMVIPAIIGTWLDNRFGTSFLAVIGLLIGVPLGLWHLLLLTKR